MPPLRRTLVMKAVPSPSPAEEPRSSPTTQEAGDTPSTRRPASSRPDPRDRQPEDEPDREPRAEPTPEPTREPEDRRRSPRKDADEEPRRFQEPKKEEEPRTRFGRPSKPAEEPKAEPAGKRPTKTGVCSARALLRCPGPFVIFVVLLSCSRFLY